MCELALYDPKDNEVVNQIAYLKGMYAHNTDGLGIVAVYRDRDDGMSYSFYKTVEPEWREVVDYLYDHNDAWRIVAHARLATAGGVGLEQAHPIRLVDDKVDFDMVMHNGVVSTARHVRKRLKNAGRKFRTTVDSEVIPFQHEEMPDDFEELEHPEGLHGSLNYVLFSEDGILLRAAKKYNLNEEEFKMGLDSRDAKACNTVDSQRGTRWMVVTEDEIKSKECEYGFGRFSVRDSSCKIGGGGTTTGNQDTRGRFDKADRSGYGDEEDENGGYDKWNKKKYGVWEEEEESEWDRWKPCECGMASAGSCPECGERRGQPHSDDQQTLDEAIGDDLEHMNVENESPPNDRQLRIMHAIADKYEVGIDYVMRRLTTGDEYSDREWSVHGRN